MYFSANTGNGFHIWRQRFPDGTPEQVTSGATEEQGISFAADGKSFVTSVGESQSTLWVHVPKGERQITFEGYAYLPSFSADTKRLYYLQRSTANRRFVSGELWATDLESGTKQRLLPDFLMENYNVSPDGKQVVFINADGTGHAPLWTATLDGSFAPRRLSDLDCVRALFAPDGDVFFGLRISARRDAPEHLPHPGSVTQKGRPRGSSSVPGGRITSPRLSQGTPPNPPAGPCRC